MLQLLLAVFIGGGTGSVARWMLSMRFNPLHQSIPFGTLTANLIGAFIIGMGFALFSRMTNIDPMWKVLITTGFCGGLTTFSTFSAEVVFASGWTFWLGDGEYTGQPARVICHDRACVLAVFGIHRALRA